MAAKGIATVALGASAGALAIVAGYYMAGKIKKLFSRKPKMKLFNNQLLLSTRCTWFISGEYPIRPTVLVSADCVYNLAGA